MCMKCYFHILFFKRYTHKSKKDYFFSLEKEHSIYQQKQKQELLFVSRQV